MENKMRRARALSDSKVNINSKPIQKTRICPRLRRNNAIMLSCMNYQARCLDESDRLDAIWIVRYYVQYQHMETVRVLVCEAPFTKCRQTMSSKTLFPGRFPGAQRARPPLVYELNTTKHRIGIGLVSSPYNGNWMSTEKYAFQSRITCQK